MGKKKMEEYIFRPFDKATLEGKLGKTAGIPANSEKQALLAEDVYVVGFSEMLNKEIMAAGRGGYPLTLLGVSVISGSLEDDRVKLQELNALVSKILKTKLRDTDSVFLYSDREFIALLPFTDRQGGDMVGGKIREILETNALVTSHYQSCQPIIAVVTYPQDGKVRDRLLGILLEKLGEARKRTRDE